MADCKCLNCGKRFGCDFALSIWAAKARMKSIGKHVSVITIRCEDIVV